MDAKVRFFLGTSKGYALKKTFCVFRCSCQMSSSAGILLMVARLSMME